MATDVQAALADPELERTTWDLEPLVEGRGDEGVDAELDEAAELADAFAERYAGRVAELDSAALAEAMRALERIYELVSRAGSYAHLRFAGDTSQPRHGAPLARVQGRGTAGGREGPF